MPTLVLVSQFARFTPQIANYLTYLLHCKSVTTCPNGNVTCPNVISTTKLVILEKYGVPISSDLQGSVYSHNHEQVYLYYNSTFAQCSSQFWLNRVGRCLKLIASTRGTFCHEFASQFVLDFCIRQKTANRCRPHTSIRAAEINNGIGSGRTEETR